MIGRVQKGALDPKLWPFADAEGVLAVWADPDVQDALENYVLAEDAYAHRRLTGITKTEWRESGHQLAIALYDAMVGRMKEARE